MICLLTCKMQALMHPVRMPAWQPEFPVTGNVAIPTKICGIPRTDEEKCNELWRGKRETASSVDPQGVPHDTTAIFMSPLRFFMC
jgi:hypothetical protein